MDKLLSILHLEDDPDFAEVVKALLERDGLRTKTVVVDNLDSFISALGREQFDIILADYGLPSCTGLQALQAAREKWPHIPFLLVSGTLGEEAAIESLKQGATDYVLKQWPERLVPAVRRAVQEAFERAQRQLAETKLISREKYLRALTENSLDVLTILDREGRFQYNSPSLKQLLGYEPGEVAGRNAFELVHGEDLPSCLAAFERALQNPELRVTHEFRFRRKDGSWCHLEVVGQNRLDDPEIAGVVLNSRDVSQRRQVEARLRLQSAALESTANAIVITDRTGNVTWANPAFTRLTGYSLKEIQGQNPRLLKSGRHDQAFYKSLWDTILAGRVWQAEMVNRRKDGSLYTEENIITPVRDERGEITHFVAIKQDVTARKQADQALVESEHRFSVFMANLPVAAFIKDHDGRTLFANKYLQGLFGWREWEMKRTTELLPAVVAEKMTADDRKALAEGPLVVQETVVDKEGRERTFETYKFPILVNGKPVLLGGVALDVTERRELESQLRQAQKMEAVGRLAGGVAHDFNNLLTVIRGYADLLVQDPQNVKGVEHLRQIASAAERAAGLTRQLLAFSRRSAMQMATVDMNALVDNLTKMLRRLIGEDIVLETTYGAGLPPIRGDASTLEQVIINLVVNARDSMPEGGTLNIRTRAVKIDDTHVHHHHEARAGDFICLSIRDSGCGISPEVMAHLFEPFFTTKDVGKGTGLGLATVHGIVKQHSGWIEVSTAVAAGTEFLIYIPVAPASEWPAAKEARSPMATARGQETILLVEDEALVRGLAGHILSRCGYQVIEADCAATALALWDQKASQIDLLLTDLIMPGGMSGRDLADKLRQARPGLKVIYTSGYSPSRAGQDHRVLEGLEFVPKPYSPDKLIQAVQSCLANGAHGLELKT